MECKVLTVERAICQIFKKLLRPFKMAASSRLKSSPSRLETREATCGKPSDLHDDITLFD